MRTSWFFLLIVLAGCEASKPPLSDVERRLQIIAQMFNRYTASHQGKTPANEKVFKEYINGLSATEKSAQGINNIDELLTSPNDHKPFIIRYGMVAINPGMSNPGSKAPGKGPPPSTSSTPGASPDTTKATSRNLFAAEASGAKRYVVFATGQVEHLPESEVLNLLK